MKFLECPELQALTNCLAGRIVGDVVYDARVEAYSLKTTKDDKRFERELTKQFNGSDDAHISSGLTEPTAETATAVASTAAIPHRRRSDSVASRSGGVAAAFGDLADVAHRRVFAHLIEALNVVFPDYDFRGLPPSSFVAVARATAVGAATVDASGAAAASAADDDRNGADSSPTRRTISSDLSAIVSSANASLADLAAEEARAPMLPAELDAIILQAAAAAAGPAGAPYHVTLASQQQEGDEHAHGSRAGAAARAEEEVGGASGLERRASESRTATDVALSCDLGTAAFHDGGYGAAAATSASATGAPAGDTAISAAPIRKRSRSRSASVAEAQPRSRSRSTSVAEAAPTPHTAATAGAAGEPRRRGPKQREPPLPSPLPAGLTALLRASYGRPFLDSMWAILDAVVDLAACDVYSYAPRWDSDPLVAGALWSFNFFFYNRAAKKVVVFYATARSTMSAVAAAVAGPVGSPVKLRQVRVARGAAVSVALQPYDAADEAAARAGRQSPRVRGIGARNGRRGAQRRQPLAASPAATYGGGVPAYLDDDSAAAMWGARQRGDGPGASDDDDDNLAAAYGRGDDEDDSRAPSAGRPDDDDGPSRSGVASGFEGGTAPNDGDDHARRRARRVTAPRLAAGDGDSGGDDDGDDSRSDWSYNSGDDDSGDEPRGDTVG